MWLTSTTGRPPSTEEHHNEKLLEGDLHCEINFDYTLLHKTSKRNKNLQRFLNTRETKYALCGMPLIKAKRCLEEVLAHKQAIPFTHLCRGVGRTS
ncbi:60S ribosomal protein L17-2 [Tanacetum coccineum]